MGGEDAIHLSCAFDVSLKLILFPVSHFNGLGRQTTRKFADDDSWKIRFRYWDKNLEHMLKTAKCAEKKTWRNLRRLNYGSNVAKLSYKIASPKYNSVQLSNRGMHTLLQQLTRLQRLFAASAPVQVGLLLAAVLFALRSASSQTAQYSAYLEFERRSGCLTYSRTPATPRAIYNGLEDD